jgi:hypothetical protein
MSAFELGFARTNASERGTHQRHTNEAVNQNSHDQISLVLVPGLLEGSKKVSLYWEAVGT